MPDDDAHDGLYWGLAAGGVHLVGLDTESPLDVAQMKPEQVAWLEGELTVPPSGVRDGGWTVVLGHRPLYCSQSHPDTVKWGKVLLRRALEDTLLAHEVGNRDFA